MAIRSDAIHSAQRATPPRDPIVRLVTVSFNSSGIIKNLLESIPKHTQVVVVDNGSKDAAQTQALAEAQGATFVALPINKGFGSACNAGAEFSMDSQAAPAPDYLFFVNPDAVLREGTIKNLIETAERFPDASAFNPKILDAKNRMKIRKRSVLMNDEPRLKEPFPDQPFQVPVLSGAALFVSTSAFQQVQGFDEKIFLYHEDDDLCIRLGEQVGPLMCAPDAVVQHIGSASSENNAEVNWIKGWHMGRSRLYTARKHKLKRPFLSTFSAAFFQFISPVALLNKRRRQRQWAFLCGVWSLRTA